MRDFRTRLFQLRVQRSLHAVQQLVLREREKKALVVNFALPLSMCACARTYPMRLNRGCVVGLCAVTAATITLLLALATPRTPAPTSAAVSLAQASFPALATLSARNSAIGKDGPSVRFLLFTGFHCRLLHLLVALALTWPQLRRLRSTLC